MSVFPEIFIEECIKQGATTETEIISAAEEETQMFVGTIKQKIRDKDVRYPEEIQFRTHDCGRDLMYDAGEDEYYCPVCP